MVFMEMFERWQNKRESFAILWLSIKDFIDYFSRFWGVNFNLFLWVDGKFFDGGIFIFWKFCLFLKSLQSVLWFLDGVNFHLLSSTIKFGSFFNYIQIIKQIHKKSWFFKPFLLPRWSDKRNALNYLHCNERELKLSTLSTW